MEIKVTIHAPELVEAIHALAKSMTKEQKPEVGITFSNNPKLDTPEVPVKTETLTLIDLRSEISGLIKSGKLTNDDVRVTLEKYGASKLTELDAEKYTLFRNELLG